MRGNLYIVSAPSGSGKTTILQHLLRSFTDLKFSVSYTTRRPRQGEHNGTDYFFTDRATFLGMVERGQFLEWAEFNGELYGTGRGFVDEQKRHRVRGVRRVRAVRQRVDHQLAVAVVGRDEQRGAAPLGALHDALETLIDRLHGLHGRA